MLYLNKEEVLKWYMIGFKDELLQNESVLPDETIICRAYEIGKIDAIIGDDIPGHDTRSEEEILKDIFKAQ